MLIRLQSSQLKTRRIYNLTAEITKWRFRGQCESGVYRLEIILNESSVLLLYCKLQ